MQYFVVTHRSIVEAEDETSAARLAVGKIAGARELAFEVKAEGMAIKRVITAGITQTPDLTVHSPAVPACTGEFVAELEPADGGKHPAEPEPGSLHWPSARSRVTIGSAAVFGLGVACLLLSIAVRYG